MGWVFPIIRKEKTSTLPTWRGVWEKGKLLEKTAGVAESSGRLQVSVKPKILRVDWEAMARMKFVDSWLTIPETHRKRQRCSRRGADRTQLSKIALPSACDVRALFRENKNLLETYYRLPDSAWEVRKNTLTWDDIFYYLWNIWLYSWKQSFIVLLNKILVKLVCGGHSGRNMAAVASSRWMLHIGGGWGDSPFCVKCFKYPEKHYINNNTNN